MEVLAPCTSTSTDGVCARSINRLWRHVCPTPQGIFSILFQILPDFCQKGIGICLLAVVYDLRTGPGLPAFLIHLGPKMLSGDLHRGSVMGILTSLCSYHSFWAPHWFQTGCKNKPSGKKHVVPACATLDYVWLTLAVSLKLGQTCVDFIFHFFTNIPHLYLFTNNKFSQPNLPV